MCRELTDSQVKKGRLMGELHAHCVQIAVCRWESSHRLTGREGLRLERDVNHVNHGSPDLLSDLESNGMTRDCWGAVLDGPCRGATGIDRIQ